MSISSISIQHRYDIVKICVDIVTKSTISSQCVCIDIDVTLLIVGSAVFLSISSISIRYRYGIVKICVDIVTISTISSQCAGIDIDETLSISLRYRRYRRYRFHDRSLTCMKSFNQISTIKFSDKNSIKCFSQMSTPKVLFQSIQLKLTPNISIKSWQQNSIYNLTAWWRCGF